MNLYGELMQKALREGSIEERFFIERNLTNSKKSQETKELIASMVRNLYEKGYTPAEVKGCLEFVVRCSIYQIPRLSEAEACDR